VQRTGHFGRLLRLFAARRIFCIITSLVIFAAIRVDSQKPMLAVAMVRHTLPQKKMPLPVELPVATKPPVATHDLFATKIVPPPVDLIRKDEKKIPTEPEAESAPNLPWDLLSEKPDNSDQFSLVRLLHKKLGVNGRSPRWLDVQAGYGAACFDHDDMKKIAPDWQPPSCLYVKASFSF
jgi:hypothetical protein